MTETGSPRSAPGTGLSTGTRIAGVSVLVGAVVGLVTLLLGAPAIAPAVGWDGGALTYLVWTWLVIGPMSAPDTAAHATGEDPSRPVSDVLLVAAAVASLGAVAVVLVQASSEHGGTQDMLAAIGVLTVALAWLVVPTVYTLQ